MNQSIRIISYEPANDTFKYLVVDDQHEYEISAALLPALIQEYDEPENLVDREFEVKLP